MEVEVNLGRSSFMKINPKVFFPKVHFSNVYFPKVYFCQVYFSKVYFCSTPFHSFWVCFPHYKGDSNMTKLTTTQQIWAQNDQFNDKTPPWVSVALWLFSNWVLSIALQVYSNWNKLDFLAPPIYRESVLKCILYLPWLLHLLLMDLLS